MDPGCPESCATLQVFSNNKPRGRITLANYVLPFSFTADTDSINRRKNGKNRQGRRRMRGQKVIFAASCMMRSPALLCGRPNAAFGVNVSVGTDTV